VFDPLSNAMLGGPMIILENFDFWEETDIRKANVFSQHLHESSQAVDVRQMNQDVFKTTGPIAG
jgi:hypothetical protein